MTSYNPKQLSTEAFQHALKLPKTFWPVATREDPEKTMPCFRDRATKKESSWALASSLLKSPTQEHFVLCILAAYVTACRNPTGTGLIEALSKGLGEGPLLPPPSLFAPIGDTVDEIITGLGRTLLKLRMGYELVLPRSRPLTREVEQSRLVIFDHVRELMQSDRERAVVYVGRLQEQLGRLLESSPPRRRSSRRPPPL